MKEEIRNNLNGFEKVKIFGVCYNIFALGQHLVNDSQCLINLWLTFSQHESILTKLIDIVTR